MQVGTTGIGIGIGTNIRYKEGCVQPANEKVHNIAYKEGSVRPHNNKVYGMVIFSLFVSESSPNVCP